MNSFRKIFFLNFLASFSILFLIKLFLAYHILTSGEVGHVSPLNIAAKIPLTAGSDIAGAIAAALLISLAARPFSGGKIAPYIVSALLQAMHAFFAVLSFHLLLIIGGQIDKALIDLALFGQDEGDALTGSLSDSISRYITAGRVAVTILCCSIPPAVVWFLRRRELKPERKTRAVIYGVCLTLMAVAFFLLPGLSSGRLLGTRILPYGLERNALVDFVSSYIQPVVESIAEPVYMFEDNFHFRHGITSDGAGTGRPVFEGAQRTDLLLVVLESVSAEYFEDENDVRMPFLKSLAGKGVYLGSHYTHWAQSMKALFSLLCSEFPYPGHKPETDLNLMIPCVSLMEQLHASGYHTSVFMSCDSNFHRMKSFFKMRSVDELYDMNSMPGSDNCWRNSWGIDEKVTVEAILEWIRIFRKKEPEERFFLTYIMSLGHHPYTFPGIEKDKVKSDWDAYNGTLSYVDTQLKNLIEGLERMGSADKTLIVVLSDHGEGFGRHLGGAGHGPMVYDEHMRVPAIFVGPQIKNGGHKEETPTGHIDIAPTILGLLGIEIPATMKGVNLAVSPPSGVIFMGGRSPNRPLGVRAGKWKYIFNQDTSIEELYDLRADPLEKDNLIDRFPDIAAKYKDAVLKWKFHTKYLIENYPEIKKKHGMF